MAIEPRLPTERLISRGLSALAYTVIHLSALNVLLTFALAVNGVQFFYLYPRRAETILPPLTLHAVVWLGSAIFAVVGLVALCFVTRGMGQERVPRRFVRAMMDALIGVTLLVALVFPDFVPLWCLGVIAMTICWVRFRSGITKVVGDKYQLFKSFLASLFLIGAIIEIWSLARWSYASVAPFSTLGKVGSDFEMNLTYSTSSLFPVVFVVAWLSPIWIYIVVRMYRILRKGKLAASDVSTAVVVQRGRLGLEDLVPLLVIISVCVFVGFYTYFSDPPWLVGTDAYWRYRDPLQRLIASGDSVVDAAASERHGLYLLILYGIHLATGLSPFDIVKGSPMVLATLLALVTYLSMVKLRGSRTEAFFAALFSATSFPTILGIFGSIHANWFALSMTLVALLILVSSGSPIRTVVWRMILAALCGVFLLALHPWSWGIAALFMIPAGAFFFTRREWKVTGSSLLFVVSGLVAGGLILIAGSGIERARLTEMIGDFWEPVTGQSTLLRTPEIILTALRTWAPFLNPLLMILAGIGVLFLTRELSSKYKVFLLSWMTITGLGAFLGVVLETEVWRIWYVQPLWILGGIGAGSLVQGIELRNRDGISGPLAFQTTAMVLVAGLAVFILEPILGTGIFYFAAVAPLLLWLDRKPVDAHAIYSAALALFVLVFFLNQALRGLYPLIMDPHNFREHPAMFPG